MKPSVLLTVAPGVTQLATAVLDRADLELVIFHDRVAPLLEYRGIPFRRFNELLTPELCLHVERDVTARAETITKALFSTEMRAEWPQFDDKTWAALRAEITRQLRQDFSLEMILIDMLRCWAGETDLRLVVVQEDICRDSKTICFAARQLGIPSLHTLHGFPGGTVNAITMNDPYNTDMVAVFSERAKAIYESLGIPPEKILVTGNFAWDIYTRPLKPDQRATACQTFGLDPKRPVVVYALTYACFHSKIGVAHALYTHLTTDAVMDAFVDLGERHPDWQFVLRPHPNDPNTPQNLLERAERAGLKHVRIDSGIGQTLCLAMADVIICTQSNLGIEAILVGKPVVNCVIDEFSRDVFLQGIGPLFSENDAVLFARRTKDIAPAIEAALLDPETRQRLRAKRPETIRRFNHLNDGKATERLCSLILDMVEHGDRYLTPVNRFPEFEPALARVIPVGAKQILVIGRAAGYVTDAVQSVQPKTAVEIQFAPSVPGGKVKYEVVVLSDPVCHGEEGEDLLRQARALLQEDGTLVAPFRHGANVEAREAFRTGAWAPARDGAEPASHLGAYSRHGMEGMVSRCGLEPDAIVAVPTTAADNPGDSSRSTETSMDQKEPIETIDGWVVRARIRTSDLGPLGKVRAEQKRRADEKNRRGEALLQGEQYEKAAAQFAEAISEGAGEATYFNNLGMALCALGDREEAWRRFREALHYDPYFQPARENLRAVAVELGRTTEAEHLLRQFGSDLYE